MKKLAGIIVIVVMVLLCGNAFAEPLEEFSKAIQSIEQEFENIFEALGDSLKEEGSFSLNDIRAAAEKIETEANSIVALGEENDREDWAFEADELTESIDECLERFDENEFDEALFTLARAFHMFNLLQMISPRYVRNELSERY
ncbi:MAG: hypothetical protein GY801_11370 [bacterium]|nr:hypothetical protein [bacterium]